MRTIPIWVVRSRPAAANLDASLQKGFNNPVGLHRSVFERYYRELLNFLARKVGDRELAADLTQESYARVYAVSGMQSVPEPRALLYTTARNLVTDHYRRSNVRAEAKLETSGDEDPAESDADAVIGPQSLEPDAILAGRQRLAAIERAISELPPRPREAFVLYKLDGLSRGEVAEKMGVSVKTVETHLEIAMQACIRQLQALEGVGPAAAMPAESTSRRKAPHRE